MDKKNYKINYRAQKYSAEKRGIEWQFTFESWLAWWGDDIVNRGRSKGQLVMARNGDIGPYHPNNVRKATTKENHNECHLGKVSWNKGISPTEETKQKMSDAHKTRSKMTEETKEKLSASLTGRTLSEQHRQRIKESWIRRKQNG